MRRSGVKHHKTRHIGWGMPVLAAFAAASVRGAMSAPTCNVTHFGAVPDNTTDNAAAIARAVEACSGPQGGTVLVPNGTFATGAFNLSSNVVLELVGGAQLRGSAQPSAYPVLPPLPSWGGSYYCSKGHSGGNFFAVGLPRYSPLVYCLDCNNVTIRGNGVIDGGGPAWWARCVNDGTKFDRPHLLQMQNCTNVNIEGVTLQQSANWNLHLVYTRSAALHGLFLHSERVSAASFNTDGIDVDSSSDVTIRNCTIDVNDDGIAMKSGYDAAGRDFGVPTRDVTIEDCDVRRADSLLAIGSDMSGGIHNVTMQRVRGGNLKRGLYVKTRRGRGGDISGITLRDSTLNGAHDMLTVDMWYFCKELHPGCADCVPCPLGNSTTTPSVSGIRVENVTLVGGQAPGGFAGLPESPIAGIALESAVAVAPVDAEWAPCNNVSGTYDATTSPAPACLTPR